MSLDRESVSFLFFCSENGIDKYLYHDLWLLGKRVEQRN
jgi:hypothetical protein